MSRKSQRAETNGGLRVAPTAAAPKTSLAGDSDSEGDSDLDDFAFDHPSTYKDAPWIWIPKVMCIQPADEYIEPILGFYSGRVGN